MSAAAPATGPRPMREGSQPERTRLAWTRTALGLLGNAALVALRAPQSSVPWLSWATVAMAAAAGVFVLLTARRRELELREFALVQGRIEESAPAERGRTWPPSARRRLTWLGLLVCGLGVMVAVDSVVAVLSPG